MFCSPMEEALTKRRYAAQVIFEIILNISTRLSWLEHESRWEQQLIKAIACARHHVSYWECAEHTPDRKSVV